MTSARAEWHAHDVLAWVRGIFGSIDTVRGRVRTGGLPSDKLAIKDAPLLMRHVVAGPGQVWTARAPGAKDLTAGGPRGGSGPPRHVPDQVDHPTRHPAVGKGAFEKSIM